MKQIEVSGGIFLESLTEEYVASYLASFSRIVQALVHVSDREAERVYVEECLIKQKENKTFFYCIVQQKNTCIGAIEIRSEWEYLGQLYCWLNEQYWGIGIFQQAMVFAAHDYFMQTNALFFTAHVDQGNKRSYWALKKCGFADFGFVAGPRGLQYRLALRKK